MIKLIQGDCLEILPTLEAGSVDAVITDPPYGVGLNYSGMDDSAEAYYALATKSMPEMRRLASGFVALTPGMKHLNWWYRTFPPDWTLAWYKSNQCSRNSYGGFNVWEPILFWAVGGTVITQDAFARPIRRQKGVGDHPCPKELGAWKTLIERLDGKSEIHTILDPFMGSGTTGVACVQTGRSFIGIEIDPGYFEIAKQRIEEAQMQPRLELEPGYSGTATARVRHTEYEFEEESGKPSQLDLFGGSK